MWMAGPSPFREWVGARALVYSPPPRSVPTQTRRSGFFGGACRRRAVVAIGAARARAKPPLAEPSGDQRQPGPARADRGEDEGAAHQTASGQCALAGHRSDGRLEAQPCSGRDSRSCTPCASARNARAASPHPRRIQFCRTVPAGAVAGGTLWTKRATAVLNATRRIPIPK